MAKDLYQKPPKRTLDHSLRTQSKEIFQIVNKITKLLSQIILKNTFNLTNKEKNKNKKN